MPKYALVTAAIISTTQAAVPANLVTDFEEDDILNAGSNIEMVNAYDLRENPERIKQMVN